MGNRGERGKVKAGKSAPPPAAAPGRKPINAEADLEELSLSTRQCREWESGNEGVKLSLQTRIFSHHKHAFLLTSKLCCVQCSILPDKGAST